ncbi:MAG: cupin domain-containing protein [Actinomycetota bacterium]
MQLVNLAEAPAYDPDRVVARPFLDGGKCNVRVIRLSPGQTLPPHTHGESDLMLLAAEGKGVLHTDDGPVPFPEGSLAYYRGEEELRVGNEEDTGLTLLAFLAPPFPPAR